MELRGKIIVFVGGFGGIGMETCKCLLQKNIKQLLILDQEENPTALAELKALAGDCLVQFYKFNATMDKSDVQKVFDRVIEDVQYIDIFIYGAGILNEQRHELVFQVNLIGYVNTLTSVMPHMDKRNGGRGGLIVSIASVAGIDPLASIPVYSASKSALVAITRSLSHDVIYDQTHISFMTICPGLTRTPILRNLPTFLDLEPHYELVINDSMTQSASVCAQNLVAAIEQGKNGAIWKLDMGAMEQVNLSSNWKPPEGWQ